MRYPRTPLLRRCDTVANAVAASLWIALACSGAWCLAGFRWCKCRALCAREQWLRSGAGRLSLTRLTFALWRCAHRAALARVS